MRKLVWLVVSLVLVSCGGVFDDTVQTEVTPMETITPTIDPASATAIPTVAATPTEPDNLTLWFPDVLLTSGNGEELTDLLNEQIAGFAASENGVQIEIRRKRLRDAGGIMPTLRTARDVAPGALPDLTIIRREDLLSAVQANLLVPMEEGVVPTAILGDLYTNALELGQVNNTLYGLPYALEIQHVVYNPDEITDLGARFDMYLDNEVPFIFPGLRANGLNNIFLVQYLAAGGSVSENGALVVNEEALRSTLEFYERAAEKELVTSTVFNYTRSFEYRSLLTGTEPFGAAVVNSQLYLELTDAGQNLSVVSIPTRTGEPTTSLDGWIWVMTTNNPNRQAHVSAFLDWMMDADRQGEYVRALDLLPSQRAAMRRWYDEEYDSFVNSLMTNAATPLSEVSGGAAARAMQTALISVINGDKSAESATQEILNQLSN